MSQTLDKQLQLTPFTIERTCEEIKLEIRKKFGFIPPLFEAAQTSQVLENLWQHTLIAYVNNPLSSLFKEKLSAYLSRFCAVSYCMICHSCSLRTFGMSARYILELLETPLPLASDIEEHLSKLAAHCNLLTDLPEPNSQLEESLLFCSVFIASPDSPEYYRIRLRQIIGVVNYQHIVTFIAYVKTCHVWMEAHPEVTYEADQRVIDNLETLFEEEPFLADFFHNYRDKVKGECQSRAEQLAELAERKRSEEKIREQAALLDVASDSINVRSLDNQILFWNLGAERLYGWKQHEALGQNANKLLYKGKFQLEQPQQVVLEKGFWQGELYQVNKSGKEIIVSSRWTLVRDQFQQPKSILVVNTDITEKKQLEI